MSDRPTINLVVEGKTDVIVFQRVLDEVFSDGYEPKVLRPLQREEGALSGWTEVRQWCKDHRKALLWLLGPTQNQILIVHVDADARKKLKVNTTAALCETIKGWLGAGLSSPRLVIVIPKEATEAWLLATVGSATPQIEEERDPRARLIALGQLPGHAAPWSVKEQCYERLSGLLVADLQRYRTLLVELHRFLGKLERIARSQVIAP